MRGRTTIRFLVLTPLGLFSPLSQCCFCTFCFYDLFCHCCHFVCCFPERVSILSVSHPGKAFKTTPTSNVLNELQKLSRAAEGQEATQPERRTSLWHEVRPSQIRNGGKHLVFLCPTKALPPPPIRTNGTTKNY